MEFVIWVGTRLASSILELQQVDSPDREARRLGVARQSLIRFWLADTLAQPTHASKP
jgi:hypothetical protein